jgi:hypothetical protein
MTRKVRVSWTTTATTEWQALIDVPDGVDPDEWNGDAAELVAFEDAYQAEHGLQVDEFVREVDEVEGCPGHPVEDTPANAHGGFGIGDTVECDGRCLPAGMEKQVAAWDVARRTAEVRAGREKAAAVLGEDEPENLLQRAMEAPGES